MLGSWSIFLADHNNFFSCLSGTLDREEVLALLFVRPTAAPIYQDSGGSLESVPDISCESS
jgi:hypothetical protein